jgi:acyl carrier protein
MIKGAISKDCTEVHTTPEDISQAVIDILLRKKTLDPATIRPETTLASLGIDSLGGLEVMFAIEDRFNISIPVEEAASLKTVGAIIAGVQRLLEKPPASPA